MRLLILLVLSIFEITSMRSALAQSFTDVPVDHWAASFIETLASNGVTAGCGGGNYCPGSSVTRAQMAVFLERGMNGSSYSPPAATGTVFLDVAASDFAASFIEQLAADGITAGCGNNNYCSDETVTRDQMAVFLLRAKYSSSYSPPAATGAFADVPVNHWAASWIEQLAAEGVTAGCGSGNYCPGSAVTRDQMAVFLVRIFDLTNIIPMTLSGFATDMPLANASISATVISAGSNGSSSQVFNTVADAQGMFSVDITAESVDDFVVLMAEGVGSQQGARLKSSLGTIDLLKSSAAGQSTVDLSNYGAMEISHISTAVAVLAEQSHGGPIFTDEDLAMAQSRVVGAELLNMASVIKTVVDNAEVTLPPGSNNTLELVQDQFVYSGFLADLELNHAQFFASATFGTADFLDQKYVQTEIPGTLYFVARDNFPLWRSSYAFTLNSDNTGEAILHNGRADLTWSVFNDGSIVMNLTNSPVTESFPTNPLPNPINSQVRALEYTDQIVISRLTEGVDGDQTLVLERRVTDYPDEPELDQEISGDIIGPDRMFLAVRSENLQQFSVADVAGEKIAAAYFHQSNNSPHSYIPEFATDFLTFNPDGTGISDRQLLTFVWTINNGGAIVIRFANGDESKIVRYSQDNVVVHTIVVGRMANGESKVGNSELIEYDGVSDFSEQNLLNRRYRAVYSLSDPDFDQDFLFLDGGAGCVVNASDGQEYFYVVDWSLTAANTVDFYRYYSWEPNAPLFRRAWEIVAVEAGQFGDRYWVIENRELNGNLDPAFVFLDPAATPGRMNSYEFIQDLTGQANPCEL